MVHCGTIAYAHAASFSLDVPRPTMLHLDLESKLQYVTRHVPQTVSTKLIKGHDDKPKGFGYVEFTTLDGLKEALERSGGQMQGRTVRVSVAEPRESSSLESRNMTKEVKKQMAKRR